MVREILIFIGSAILFFIGCLLYGLILQSGKVTLAEAAAEKEVSLFSNVHIVIKRQSQILYLYSDTTLVKQYSVIFGRNSNAKMKNGDLATPRGSFEICSLDSSENFYKFIRIYYPTIEIANNALQNNSISVENYSAIVASITSGNCIDDSSSKSEPIGIHGYGQLNFIFKYLPFAVNWTNGSVAMSNEEIDELFSVVKKGTKIVIQE